ncbi:MAG: hypothetical protein ACRETH_01620 [Steroidobacteraceae bacterium]
MISTAPRTQAGVGAGSILREKTPQERLADAHGSVADAIAALEFHQSQHPHGWVKQAIDCLHTARHFLGEHQKLGKEGESA